MNTNTINRILLITIFLLATATSLLYKQSVFLKTERDRYRENAGALLSDMKRMQVDSTLTAVDVKQLKLTVDEYKRYRAEDAEKIKQMGVRLSDLQMAAKHGLEVNAPIETALKDSVVIRDTVLLAVKTIHLNTPHLQINGIIENNHLSGRIHLPVNILQAVWIERKHKFLWWRWGIKAIHQTISSDNPHVEITYSEVVIIQPDTNFY
jgi:hypothetical protein